MKLLRPTWPKARLRLRAVTPTDEGIGIVELMVAIVIFGMLSAAVLTTLNLAMGLTRADRNRVAASNLAARELEIVRRDFTSTITGPKSISLNQVINPTPLPGGTVGQPLVVDNVAYTVTRVAQWTSAGAGAPASACDDGSTDELTTMKVHVEVTWVKMGSIKPVEADTLLTPRKGVYNSATGHIAVKVLDRNGVGVANHTVSISGPSGSANGETADDGCALFAFLTPGAYTVTVNDPGYVDRQGAAVPTMTATVTSAQIWKGNFDYDLTTTINATFVTTDATYPLPQVMDLTLDLGNGGLLPSGSTTRPGAGVTRTATNLWPYPSGYQLWAGDCLDSDPLTSGDSRAAPVTVTPGGTVNANVDLGQVALTLSRLLLPVSGVTMQAVHANDSSCQAGDTVTLGVTGVTGALKSSLPYGTWTLKAVGKTPVLAWPTVTIRRGQAPGSALVFIT